MAPTPGDPPNQESVNRRFAYAFKVMVLNVEEATEWVLDKVLGPAPVPVDKNKAPHPLLLAREQKRRKEHKIRQLLQQEQEAEIMKRRMEWEMQVKAERIGTRLHKQQLAEEQFKKDSFANIVSNKATVLQITLVQVGGLFAVSQACLLGLFVPQKCPASGPLQNSTSPWFVYETDLPPGHLCAMKENLDWHNDSKFNQSVLSFNALTLIVMLLSQSFFWKREVWCIEHLEEDDGTPYANLPIEIKKYEDFEATVAGLNSGAYGLACTLMSCVMFNFAISTYFLVYGDEYYNYFLGSRTVTGLLTNTMLVSNKLSGWFSYARISHINSWACSLFNVKPLSYNRVDDNFKNLGRWKSVEALREEATAEVRARRAMEGLAAASAAGEVPDGDGGEDRGGDDDDGGGGTAGDGRGSRAGTSRAGASGKGGGGLEWVNDAGKLERLSDEVESAADQASQSQR